MEVESYWLRKSQHIRKDFRLQILILWPAKLNVCVCLSFSWVAINMTFVDMSSKRMLTLTSACTATVIKQ